MKQRLLNIPKQLIRLYQSVFISSRFFLALGILVVSIALSHKWSWLLWPSLILTVLLILALLADQILLWSKKEFIHVERITPDTMSLSDVNWIHLHIDNLSKFDLDITIIDEVPYQFQIRDFSIQRSIKKEDHIELKYDLRPVERGEYLFRNINVFVKTKLGLAERRIIIEKPKNVAVYPSYIQMKKYTLMAFNKVSTTEGLKKIRKFGNNQEFDQIKTYVRGDDFRTINWKATSKRRELMVNVYDDEKAQQIYFAIDTSRNMLMPFNNLSLLDYAINSSLALSNIALKKYDKAGLLTFSKTINTTLKAVNNRGQLKKINEYLYRQQESQTEGNFELLYQSSRKFIKGRSLIFLFTNFQSKHALDRNLHLLKKINNIHLLVVVFFKNTELQTIIKQDPENISDIYDQTIAINYVQQQEQMLRELRKNGIQAILTEPENLSINSINKYLELKAKGLI